MPSAHTLVRWVNENAFAPIVRARPCPTFGRPVYPRSGSPLITARYFSAYPSDSTSRWTPCPPKSCRNRLQVHLGCFQLSPSCPFRLLHTSSFLRPARRYSRFWIQRSSFERRRDLNPPEQRAAQRTLRPFPSPGLAVALLLATLEVRPPPLRGSPNYPDRLANMPFPLPRWIVQVLPGIFPARIAFLAILPSRHPQLHFRGLLRIHSRYGLFACLPTFMDVVTRLRSSQLPN